MSESTPVPDTADQDPEHVDIGPERVDVGFSDTAHSGYEADLAEADERRGQDGGASIELEDAPDDARTADADPAATRGGEEDGAAGPH